MKTISCPKTIDSIVNYCHRNNLATKQFEPESIHVLQYTKSVIPATVNVTYNTFQELLYIAIQLDIKVPANQRVEILEFLNHANEGILRGNYHLCHCCARLKYAASFNMIDATLSDAQIEQLFDEPIQTCYIFGEYVENIINQQTTLADAIKATSI